MVVLLAIKIFIEREISNTGGNLSDLLPLARRLGKHPSLFVANVNNPIHILAGIRQKIFTKNNATMNVRAGIFPNFARKKAL